MKILEVCGKLNIGGAQAVAANISKYADEDMQFTYIVFEDDVGALEEDIKNKGHEILHIDPPSDNIAKFFVTLIRIMKREKFDVVHCHTMFNCGVVMLAARIAGVPCRASHSHTTNDDAGQGIGRTIYRFFMRLLIWCCATEFLACGFDAGCELYGRKRFEKNGVIIKNGIDISNYCFSEENRKSIREKYGVEDKFVIGHVGHYVGVKNQKFLIGIMPQIVEKKPNAELLMFGDGEDREMLSSLIEKNRLEKSARLMGNVNNVSEVLSAFDVFAFPSLFEGTPLALIEAQANGVPCIVSDLIPKDACLTDIVCPVSIQDESGWILAIVNASRMDSLRYADELRTVYADINDSMEELYKIFRNYKGERR